MYFDTSKSSSTRREGINYLYTYSGKDTFSNFVLKSRPSVGPASAAPCQPSPTAYSSAARGTLLPHVFRTHRAHGHLQHSPVARCRAARPTPGFSALRSFRCKNHRPPPFAPLPSAPVAVCGRGLRHAAFICIQHPCIYGRPQHRPVARCQAAGPTLEFSAFLSIACMNNFQPQATFCTPSACAFGRTQPRVPPYCFYARSTPPRMRASLALHCNCSFLPDRRHASVFPPLEPCNSKN